MSQTLLVLSAGRRGNGLTSISLGLVRALQRCRARVGFCKPVAQPETERGQAPDAASALALLTTGSAGPAPLGREEVEALLSEDAVGAGVRVGDLLEAGGDDAGGDAEGLVATVRDLVAAGVVALVER